MKRCLISLFLVFACAGIQAATITVNTTSDAGPGSLRSALAQAGSGDTIAFSITGTIRLVTGELFITNSVRILGPGSTQLGIDGNAASRVLHVASNVVVVLSGLTVTNGRTWFGDGAALFNDGQSPSNTSVEIINSVITGNAGYGFEGAIVNTHATLILSNSTLAGNSAGGGGSSGYGGAIYNALGTVIIRNSTLTGNWCEDHGGAIFNTGANPGDTCLYIINSTISGNRAYRGGGIYNDYGGALLQILNSTIAGNIAPEAGNNILNFVGTVEIGSSILDVGEDYGDSVLPGYGTVTSLGYNISSDNTGPNDGITDQLDTDPKLGPLQDNGGPSFTHKPLACSPAIDNGKNFSSSDLDQRGDTFARTFDNPDKPNAMGGDGTDIGAFETQTVTENTPPVINCNNVTVSATADCVADASIDNGSYDPDDGDWLAFAPNPPGPYPLGTNTVVMTISDRCGAFATCTGLVIVADTTPPAIECPPPIYYLEATIAVGAIVIFPQPAAVDSCNSILSSNCTPASGSAFASGVTTVTCVAVDAAYNAGTCSFTVYVAGAAEQAVNLYWMIYNQYGSKGQGPLLSPLKAAARSAAKGNTKSACRAIGKFEQHVQSRLSKAQVSSDAAYQYLGACAQIRSVLNCI